MCVCDVKITCFSFSMRNRKKKRRKKKKSPYLSSTRTIGWSHDNLKTSVVMAICWWWYFKMIYFFTDNMSVEKTKLMPIAFEFFFLVFHQISVEQTTWTAQTMLSLFFNYLRGVYVMCLNDSFIIWHKNAGRTEL